MACLIFTNLYIIYIKSHVDNIDTLSVACKDFSRFSRKSEAFTLDFLENFEKSYSCKMYHSLI